MDPNETLKYLRDQFKHFHDYRGYFVEEFDGPGFVAAFQSLDDWITRGGFYPDDWQE